MHVLIVFAVEVSQMQENVQDGPCLNELHTIYI